MIKATLEHPTLKQRADELGRTLGAENGVSRAVEAIHALKLDPSRAAAS